MVWSSSSAASLSSRADRASWTASQLTGLVRPRRRWYPGRVIVLAGGSELDGHGYGLTFAPTARAGGEGPDREDRIVDGEGLGRASGGYGDGGGLAGWLGQPAPGTAGPGYEVELFAWGRIGEQHEQAGAVGRPERRDPLIGAHLERR